MELCTDAYWEIQKLGLYQRDGLMDLIGISRYRMEMECEWEEKDRGERWNECPKNLVLEFYNMKNLVKMLTKK